MFGSFSSLPENFTEFFFKLPHLFPAVAFSCLYRYSTNSIFHVKMPVFLPYPPPWAHSNSCRSLTANSTSQPVTVASITPLRGLSSVISFTLCVCMFNNGNRRWCGRQVFALCCVILLGGQALLFGQVWGFLAWGNRNEQQQKAFGFWDRKRKDHLTPC